MIASLGGQIVDSNNNRTIPGAGGYVGGLSLPGRNNAWIGGAGEAYNSFTPDTSNNNPIPMEIPGGEPCTLCRQTEPGQNYPTYPGNGEPFPAPSEVPGPTTTTTPGGTTQTPPVETPPIFVPPDVIRDTINRLLDGIGMNRTRVNDSGGPLFLYQPATPQAGSSGGLNMQSLLVWGAIIVGGWFVYKKLKK